MRITKEKIKAITDRFDTCHLECDGMTRVLQFYLTKEQVPHKVYIGQIVDKRTNEGFSPHYWIKTGNLFIDYRAKMWLGEEEHIPHGVFHIKNYPEIAYYGYRIELNLLPEAVVNMWIFESSFDIEKLCRKLEKR
jgi:hypothetical protein